MKKILLSVAFLGAILSANAQQIVFEDFETLNVGNVGTDITGAALGQGAWGTYTAAGANSDFQIVNFDANYGKSIQLTGSATASNSKFMFQDLATDWNNGRTAGNDIVEMEFDIYTGGTTTSKNSHRFIIFNGDGSKSLGGLVFYPETKIVRANFNSTPGTNPNGNYTISLGGTLGDADITLAANRWYRMGFSYNATTGALRFVSAGIFDVTITNGMTYAGAALVLNPGQVPSEYDFINFAGTGNTVSTNAIFDNMRLKFTNANTLGSDANEIVSSKFSVSPNPANNVINITNADNMLVNGVTVTDLNGRTVKNVSFDNVASAQINVADLASGMYILNVTSDKGTATKKFVKN
jgi:hypothetical protein